MYTVYLRILLAAFSNEKRCTRPSKTFVLVCMYWSCRTDKILHCWWNHLCYTYYTRRNPPKLETLFNLQNTQDNEKWFFLNFFISHHIPHNQQSLQVLPGAFKLKINTFSSDFLHLPSLSPITHTHFKLLQELYSNICSIRKKALSHYWQFEIPRRRPPPPPRNGHFSFFLWMVKIDRITGKGTGYFFRNFEFLYVFFKF